MTRGVAWKGATPLVIFESTAIEFTAVESLHIS